MTRINLIPPSELVRQHLIAEYRELPRIFALAHAAHVKGTDWKARQPSEYTMGTGHMLFFYDKLKFLADRHGELVSEMIKRNYNVNYTTSLQATWMPLIPAKYWGDYIPSIAAITINQERINIRLAEMKIKGII